MNEYLVRYSLFFCIECNYFIIFNRKGIIVKIIIIYKCKLYCNLKDILNI